MASSGIGLLVFCDDVTEDRSSQMNSEVYRIYSLCPDSASKHLEFLKVKKWNILQWPSQSPDLNPTEHAFHLLKTKLKAERPTNKQQLKSAAVKAWQSITKEETQSLVMSMTSRLKAVVACKGF